MTRPRYLTRSSPSESTLMNQIRLHLGSKPDLCLFRNQGGAAEKDGRWEQYGLTKGASDLIGLLAPSGRFFALEVKSGRGKPDERQKLFVELVTKFGGYGAIVWTLYDAEIAYRHAGGKHYGEPPSV